MHYISVHFFKIRSPAMFARLWTRIITVTKFHEVGNSNFYFCKNVLKVHISQQNPLQKLVDTSAKRTFLNGSGTSMNCLRKKQFGVLPEPNTVFNTEDTNYSVFDLGYPKFWHKKDTECL